jgi:hypothetical protein
MLGRIPEPFALPSEHETVMTSSAVSPPTDSSQHESLLEDRLRRLEDAVVSMQDTRLMEERLVERVVARMASNGQRAFPIATSSGSSGILLEASRLLLPQPLSSETIHPPELNATRTIPPGREPPPPRPSPWFVVDLVQEFRTIVAMYTDYRYRPTWTGRVVPLGCALAAVISWFCVGFAPLIGGILERGILILLSFVAYKALSREATRYREMFSRPYGI